MAQTHRSYSPEFYEYHASGSLTSARTIVPILIQMFQPRSVVDFGCGVGTWLSVFESNGITNILRIDGSYVQRDTLLIPSDRFLPADLSTPIRLQAVYDLAVSVEVAEHLDRAAAETFVDSLVAASPIVAFSAAIPGQGGTDHHNEQWQSYWAKLFDARGYSCHDCIRHLVWNDSAVDPWYAQNLLVYAAPSARHHFRTLSAETGPVPMIDIVHPRIFLKPPVRFEKLRSVGRRVLSSRNRKRLKRLLPVP